MRRILLSLLLISVAGVAVVAGTRSFFSDTETSQDNTFQAGDIDLKIGNESVYLGGPSQETSWPLGDLTDEKFFNFTDLKPGDWGNDTISLQVLSNPAWVCANVQFSENSDNGFTEPEDEVDAVIDNYDGTPDGDLAQELNFRFWIELHDNNRLDPDEVVFLEGPVSNILGGVTYPLADPTQNIFTGSGGDPLNGSQVYKIGKAFCFGEFSVNNDINGPGYGCDGSPVTNISQTDRLVGSLSFYAEQNRNNNQFVCSDELFAEPEPAVRVGAALGDYQVPEEQNCDVIVRDGDNLQSEINNAASGNTVCVDEGEYNEFVVDKPLTIAGLVSPTTSATIVPSSPTTEYLALVNSGNVTIEGLHFDGEGTNFTGSQTRGVWISVTGVDVPNISINHNFIENLNGINTTAGIQWDDDSWGFSLVDSIFMHNVIRNIISSTQGSYGIQSVGGLSNMTISYNTISDIDGIEGAGVVIDAHTPDTNTDVDIHWNHIMDNIWEQPSGPFPFAIPVSVQIAHNPNNDLHNIFVNNNNLEGFVHGGSGTEAAGALINAESNWWGDTDPSDNILGPVDYDPFAASPYLTN